MKQLIFSLAALIMAFGANAQNNWIPGLNNSLGPGPVAFGLPGAPVANHVFQLHGVYDYCVSVEPQGPGGGAENTFCYGLTSHFSMTNPLTGIAAGDGALFRMSELNFTLENQEGKNLDFKTGTSGFRLNGASNNAYFGDLLTSVGANEARLNVQGASSGMAQNEMCIRTNSSSAYGLSIKTANDESIAL